MRLVLTAATAPLSVVIETKSEHKCQSQSKQASSNDNFRIQPNHLVRVCLRATRTRIEAYYVYREKPCSQTHSDLTIYSPNWEQTTLDRLMKNKARDCGESSAYYGSACYAYTFLPSFSVGFACGYALLAWVHPRAACSW